MATPDRPDQPLPQQQLRLINAFLKLHPQVAEAVAIASSLVGKVHFPVNSFQDLTDAMGGPQTAVQFGGRSFTLAEIECQVPAYYFPIANENDLVAKLGDLSKRMPSTVASTPPLIPATASAPSIPPLSTRAIEEIYKSRDQLAAGVAGVGGVAR
jgi:hypothetical protein